MEILGTLFGSSLELMATPFVLFGYTIDFWQVFCFSIVAGIVCWVLANFFG